MITVWFPWIGKRGWNPVDKWGRKLGGGGGATTALGRRAEFMRWIDGVMAPHENISSDGLCFLVTQVSEQLPPLKEPSLTTDSKELSLSWGPIQPHFTIFIALNGFFWNWCIICFLDNVYISQLREQTLLLFFTAISSVPITEKQGIQIEA